MKKQREVQSKKPLFLFVLTLAMGALFLIVGQRVVRQDIYLFASQEEQVVVPAKVVEVLEKTTEQVEWGGETAETITITFEAEIASGRRKGEVVSAQQESDPIYPLRMKEVEQGDKVMLHLFEDAGGAPLWVLTEYVRTGSMLGLAIFFALLLILFGRHKGVSTILSLVFTCFAIFVVFVPAILNGHNIYMLTLVVSLAIVFMSLALINGYNTKSFSAAVGCFGGLLVSGGLMWFMDTFFLRLTGFVDDDSVYLLNLNTENPLDLKAIVFACVIIGALGATMDVAVSIASSLHEIAENAPNMTFAEYLRSGMNIGRDILGTMTNTLLLAYIGSSLSLVLLLIVYSNSLMELLNREMIVVEIVQSLVGSIGLLFTIPLTSMVFGFVACSKGQKNSNA